MHFLSSLCACLGIVAVLACPVHARAQKATPKRQTLTPLEQWLLGGFTNTGLTSTEWRLLDEFRRAKLTTIEQYLLEGFRGERPLRDSFGDSTPTVTAPGLSRPRDPFSLKTAGGADGATTVTQQLKGAVSSPAAAGQASVPEAAGSQKVDRFAELTLRALRGEATAQCQLAQMYDEGDGVGQSYESGFKWWLAAAQKGHRAAQLKVGMAYLVGAGVTKNLTTAVRWLDKAADAGDALARQYSDTVKTWLQEPVVEEGEDSAGTALPEGAPPGQLVSAPANGSMPAPVRADRAAAPAPSPTSMGVGAKRTGATGRPPATEAQHLETVLRDYRRAQAEAKTDRDAVDLVCGLWHIVKTEGYEAKLMAGNFEKDITDVREANRAWVVVRAASGALLALDCAGGSVVTFEQNPKYFKGFAFSEPTRVREYQILAKDYSAALKKHVDAAREYTNTLARINQTDPRYRALRLPDLEAKRAVLEARESEVRDAALRLDALKVNAAALGLPGAEGQSWGLLRPKQ